jgi:hypothetical protein
MHTRSSVLVALAVVAFAGGSVAGCADGAGDGTASPGASMSSSASPGSSASPSPSGRVVPTPTPSKPSQGELTLTGLPEEGVEAGCIVMRSGGTLYLLLGGDRQLLTSGRQVMVRGTPNPGLITTCQQGTPFEVAEVRLA